MKKLFVLILAAAVLPACCNCGKPKSIIPAQAPLGAEGRAALNKLVSETVKASEAKLELAVEEVVDSLAYPTYGDKSSGTAHWRTFASRNWVSGFWPGCLWYEYALTGNEKLKRAAERWTAGIEAQKFNSKTHDLGFRFMCTFGNGIRFDSSLEDSYKPLILTAARTLSGLWRPELGVISSSWDSSKARERLGEGYIPCIVDIMMNLEVFFWAAENGGNPEWTSMCLQHADKTWRDFVREDGGTFHIVRYDAKTGEVIEKGQLQGDTAGSTWSRGHSWLVYGLVLCYRFTHDQIWLDRAKKAADYFIRNLNPDGIANWDFQSSEAYTDASASAVVCSALYEMITMLPEGREKDYYEFQADRMLASLCSPAYFLGADSPCLLDHSVRYFHIRDTQKDGHQQANIDEPCVFADYYLLEALYRYSKIHNLNTRP